MRCAEICQDSTSIRNQLVFEINVTMTLATHHLSATIIDAGRKLIGSIAIDTFHTHNGIAKTHGLRVVFVHVRLQRFCHGVTKAIQ